MKKNKLLKCENSIVKVLEIKEDDVLIINCFHKSMQKWIKLLKITSL